MAPFVIPAAIVLGLVGLYAATRGSSISATSAKATKAASGPAVFPAELQPELDRLLNAPPDQDPAALETVATRLEALGFKTQGTALRLKAAQLRAAQGAAPPTTPAPASPAPRPASPAAPATPATPATDPQQVVFVPGVIDEAPPPFVPGVIDEPAPAGRVHVPLPTRTLRDGATGPDVKQWQEFLIFLAGPTVVGPAGADGVFGAMTHAATAAFQRSQGLTDDGVAGPITYRAALAAGY